MTTRSPVGGLVAMPGQWPRMGNGHPLTIEAPASPTRRHLLPLWSAAGCRRSRHLRRARRHPQLRAVPTPARAGRTDQPTRGAPVRVARRPPGSLAAEAAQLSLRSRRSRSGGEVDRPQTPPKLTPAPEIPGARVSFGGVCEGTPGTGCLGARRHPGRVNTSGRWSTPGRSWAAVVTAALAPWVIARGCWWMVPGVRGGAHGRVAGRATVADPSSWAVVGAGFTGPRPAGSLHDRRHP